MSFKELRDKVDKLAATQGLQSNRERAVEPDRNAPQHVRTPDGSSLVIKAPDAPLAPKWDDAKAAAYAEGQRGLASMRGPITRDERDAIAKEMHDRESSARLRGLR